MNARLLRARLISLDDLASMDDCPDHLTLPLVVRGIAGAFRRLGGRTDQLLTVDGHPT